MDTVNVLFQSRDRQGAVLKMFILILTAPWRFGFDLFMFEPLNCIPWQLSGH
jgi:hypothetical protein